MAEILYGKPVAEALNANTQSIVRQLADRGIEPMLAVIRIGEDTANNAYLLGLSSCAAKNGVEIKIISLPEDCTTEKLQSVIQLLNADAAIHGILPLRPFPKHLRDQETAILNAIAPEKDVDCVTDISAVSLYLDRAEGFRPCTAEACLMLMDHYGIECSGKHIVIIGRSAVIGKPLALMLLGRDRSATVTVCHSLTKDLPSLTCTADIVISAAGCRGLIGRQCVREGQILLDVSVNWDPLTNKLCGDADFETVSGIVRALTPVPRGIGSVTSAVLISHVVRAAMNQRKEQA